MVDIPSSSLVTILVFLLIPFLLAYLAKFLKMSPVIGYIVGGLFIGNIIGNRLTHEIIDQFAFFGIILLMFTVGLEVNLAHLMTLRKYIITGGIMQALGSAVLIFLLSMVFHFSLLTSFLIALAFVSSSTILVAKILQDKGEEATFVGEVAIGLLMFQDILFIPLLIIFNSINSTSLSFRDISIDIILSIIQSVAILIVMYYVGKRVVPFVFDRIASHSRELLSLFAIVFIFFVMYLSTLFKIPILIGAFIAGILVSRTAVHHHVFSQIRPIRDMLAALFFVFIGLNINVIAMVPFLGTILAFSLLVTLIKVSVLVFTFFKLRFHSRTIFTLSVLLFQVSENAFILMYSAYNHHVISYPDYLIASTSSVLTLLFTPLIISNKEKLYTTIRSFTVRFMPNLSTYVHQRVNTDISPLDEMKYHDHIILCGYGRIGHQIGKTLQIANIPFVAIDYNYHVVEKAKKQGIPILYGDPTDINILDFAEAEKARMVIAAVSDKYSQETIILNVQKLNPKAVIIARVHKKDEGQRLKDLGVDIVIQPEFEASLSIVKKILFAFHTPNDDILSHVRRLQAEHGI